uniref:Uncharacterized protein n=1 Tax=Oryza rufipogon TaxID=4529 RepID=A0A0E0MSY5_ORYRU
MRKLGSVGESRFGTRWLRFVRHWSGEKMMDDSNSKDKTHSPLIDAIGESSSAQHHHAVASPNLHLLLLRPPQSHRMASLL